MRSAAAQTAEGCPALRPMPVTRSYGAPHVQQRAPRSVRHAAWVALLAAPASISTVLTALAGKASLPAGRTGPAPCVRRAVDRSGSECTKDSATVLAQACSRLGPSRRCGLRPEPRSHQLAVAHGTSVTITKCRCRSRCSPTSAARGDGGRGRRPCRPSLRTGTPQAWAIPSISPICCSECE